MRYRRRPRPPDQGDLVWNLDLVRSHSGKQPEIGVRPSPAVFIPTAHSDARKPVAVVAAAIDAPILETRGVTVRFGDLVANDQVTLRVYAGEVWADPSRNLSRSLGQVKRSKGSVRPR